jgi:hypothetical protein
MDSAEIRQLAASTYNEAFEVVEAANTSSEAIWALELAATSLNLWRRVGTEQNLAIGLWLYSRALVKAGAPSAAIQAAKSSLKHAENIENPADWLVASCLEGLARALVAAEHADADKALTAAKDAVAAIAAAEDRELIAGQLADLL